MCKLKFCDCFECYWRLVATPVWVIFIKINPYWKNIVCIRVLLVDLGEISFTSIMSGEKMTNIVKEGGNEMWSQILCYLFPMTHQLLCWQSWQCNYPWWWDENRYPTPLALVRILKICQGESPTDARMYLRRTTPSCPNVASSVVALHLTHYRTRVDHQHHLHQHLN